MKNNRKHLAYAELVIETINQLERELDTSGLTNFERTDKFKTIQGLYKSLKFHVNNQLEQDKTNRLKRAG